MSQHYSDPERETMPHALPDVEVFYFEQGDFGIPLNALDESEPAESGWYWWSCSPGCLPDSDPVGPFATEAEALADAQTGN